MCSDFHVISSVAHGWFTNALFNIQSLGILLVIFLFLLLVFNFQVNCIFVRTYFLWFHFQILWNLLGLALWSSMWWPILLNVLCTLEKNEFCSCLSAAFVCVCAHMCVCVCRENYIYYILYILHIMYIYNIKLFNVVYVVKILIPTLNFCLLHLLFTE